jgi:hypothetical protein
MTARRNAPVFVIGSPRSGTTLFYHMLLSAGDFAIYRTESHVFNLFAPAFGGLRARGDREKFMREWLRSEYFRLSGLTEEEIRPQILEECRNAGDFLRMLMEAIARKQGVRRWAENTPQHALYISEIKRTIPDALFIHMIRDGRDTALSLSKQGCVRPMPWDSEPEDLRLVIGIFWEWLVERGRQNAKPYAADYLEVHYEDVVTRPQETLNKVGSFIEHDLDYERIQSAGIGSVSKPNTSFGVATEKGSFQPVGRWSSGYTDAELARFEGLIGPFLEELGYELATPKEARRASAAWKMKRALYRNYFDTKHWLKSNTPLGRWLTDTTQLRDFYAYEQDRLMPEKAQE